MPPGRGRLLPRGRGGLAVSVFKNDDEAAADGLATADSGLLGGSLDGVDKRLVLDLVRGHS